MVGFHFDADALALAEIAIGIHRLRLAGGRVDQRHHVAEAQMRHARLFHGRAGRCRCASGLGRRWRSAWRRFRAFGRRRLPAIPPGQLNFASACRSPRVLTPSGLTPIMEQYSTSRSRIPSELIQLPARIGKYELQEFLAGGMSHVYRAVDTVIGRPVAVKILTDTGAQDEEAKARFLTEARTAGNLAHENIISIYDFGWDEQHGLFMVMEFLQEIGNAS